MQTLQWDDFEEKQYIPDYTKTGKELLIDLINWSNRNTMLKPLTAKDVFLSRPVKNPKTSDCNTSIRFERVVGFNKEESPITIEYNRIDINQLARLLGFDKKIEVKYKKDLTDTDVILAKLFEKFKVRLIPDEDILSIQKLDKPECDKDDNRLNYNIVISPNSIAYLGTLEIEVTVKKNVKLDTAVRNTRYPYSFMPHFKSVLG